jgi:phosphoglycolate phosphatase
VSTPLSAETLLAQGACCGNGCQNCPYLNAQGLPHVKDTQTRTPKFQNWILFDFDGTLADSLPLQKQAFSELARQNGWPEISEDDFRKLRRLSLKDALLELKIPLWRVPGLLKAGQKLLHQRWGEAKVFPGISEALDSLSQSGFQLGIVTSNTTSAVDIVLKNANIQEYFSFVVAEPHLWGKANRLRKLVKQHGWNTNRIWYVGDEVRDLEAAQDTGLTGIGVTWGLNDAEILANTGAPIVDTPQNLVHWIQTHQPN